MQLKNLLKIKKTKIKLFQDIRLKITLFQNNTNCNETLYRKIFSSWEINTPEMVNVANRCNKKLDSIINSCKFNIIEKRKQKTKNVVKILKFLDIRGEIAVNGKFR